MSPRRGRQTDGQISFIMDDGSNSDSLFLTDQVPEPTEPKVGAVAIAEAVANFQEYIDRKPRSPIEIVGELAGKITTGEVALFTPDYGFVPDSKREHNLARRPYVVPEGEVLRDGEQPFGLVAYLNWQMSKPADEEKTVATGQYAAFSDMELMLKVEEDARRKSDYIREVAHKFRQIRPDYDQLAETEKDTVAASIIRGDDNLLDMLAVRLLNQAALVSELKRWPQKARISPAQNQTKYGAQVEAKKEQLRSEANDEDLRDIAERFRQEQLMRHGHWSAMNAKIFNDIENPRLQGHFRELLRDRTNPHKTANK